MQNGESSLLTAVHCDRACYWAGQLSEDKGIRENLPMYWHNSLPLRYTRPLFPFLLH